MCFGSAFAADGPGGSGAEKASSETPVSDAGATREHQAVGIGAYFDYGPVAALRFYNLGLLGGNASTAAGSLTQMRAYGVISYRPWQGTEIHLIGGVVIGGRLNLTSATAVPVTTESSFAFENSPYYGLGLATDFIKNSRVHLIPSFQLAYIDMGGTAGSVSNTESACSYDFASNGTSTCTTLGGNTAQGVVRTRFNQLSMRARLKFAIDIGSYANPSVTWGVGGEQAVHWITGSITITPPNGTSSVVEQYALGSLGSFSAFTEFDFHLSKAVDLTLSGAYLGNLIGSGGLKVSF